MPCTQVNSAKYQTRKSPPFHAGECKDLIKKGKDGTYVSKPDSRGVYKWVKVNATRKLGKPMKGAKRYDIHDNGGRPFRVEVAGKNVVVYKGSPTRGPDGELDYDTMDYSKIIKKLTVAAVHVGQSTCNSAAYIKDECGKWATGNTMLLHLRGKKYMYVGSEIYEFTMEDDFEAFYSQVGNNDVPYPVVVGSKYVYFLLDGDHNTLPRTLFKARMNATEWADAYAYYYGVKNLTTGERDPCFDKYRTRAAERTKCRNQWMANHRRTVKGAHRPMKGVKMIWERGA
jgi:hypothetical protein